MKQSIKQLLLVALKPEWAFLKQQYRFKQDDHLKELYWIQETRSALLQLGVGPERSINTLKKILKIYDVNQLLHFGVSGALEANFKVGNLFTAEEIFSAETNQSIQVIPFEGVKSVRFVTVNHPLENRSQKEEAHQKSNAQLVDMESYVVARCCLEHQLNYQSLRGVFDELHDDIADLGEPYTSAGELRPVKIAVNLVKNPSLISKLPGLQKRMQLIQKNLKPHLMRFLEIST